MEITDFTHIGSRDYQEDRFKVTKRFANRDELSLLVVCDGHGGKSAAIWLVDHFEPELREIVDKTDDKKYTIMMRDALANCVDKWDRICFGEHLAKINTQQDKVKFFADRTASEMKRWQENELESGTTICAAIVDKKERFLHILHLGDSRATWICDKKLIGSTVDHCVPTFMPPNANFPFEYGNGYVQDDLAMCKSFGDNTEKLFRVISREPDILKVNIGQNEARLVLATDGLFDYATDHDVLYNELLDAKTIAYQVPKFDDNITVIYAKIPPATGHEVATEEKQSVKGRAPRKTSIKKARQVPTAAKDFDSLMKDLKSINIDQKPARKSTKKKH